VADQSKIHAIVDELCSAFGSREEALVVITDLAVLVAAADGTIDEAEALVLRRSLEAMLSSRVAPSLVRVVVDESRTRMRVRGPDVCSADVGETLGRNGAIDNGLRFAFLIAASSEGVSDVERMRIDAIAKAAGISSEEVSLIANTIVGG